MTKFTSSFFILTGILGVAVFLTTIIVLQPGPMDDLSFSARRSPEIHIPKILSEEGVREILADRLVPKLEPGRIHKLAHHLVYLSRKYSFDPSFVLAVIQVESTFRSHAVSPVGAVGLMQVMPETAAIVADDWGMRLGKGKATLIRALKNPFLNLSIGMAYLSNLRAHYRGRSQYYLVAAYNIGPARLDDLITRPDFKPSGTLTYWKRIQRYVPRFRDYIVTRVRMEFLWPEARRRSRKKRILARSGKGKQFV